MDASCSFLVVVRMVAVVVHDGHSDAAAADDVRRYHHYTVGDCGVVFLLLLLRRLQIRLDIEKKIMVDSSMMRRRITTVEDNRGNMTWPDSARNRARAEGGRSDHPARVLHDQTHLSS